MAGVRETPLTDGAIANCKKGIYSPAMLLGTYTNCWCLAADLLDALLSSAPSSPSSSARSSPELLRELVGGEGELTEEALQSEFTTTPKYRTITLTPSEEHLLGSISS